MSSVRIVRTWPDGEVLEVHVWAESSYPEAIAVARENALQAMRDATEIVIPTDETTP
jgi:hypothetical protein